MTAGHNGSDTPENDDPFAYLYRSEGEQGDQGSQSGSAPRSGGYGYPGPAQPGVPRTSYNHVRAVGERTYGQQIPNQQPQGHPQQQGGYGQQNAHYAAPETLPGGAPRQPATAPRGGHGGGPNRKGLLIGALAVVAVVIVGIGVAMINNGDDKDGEATPTNQATAGSSVDPDETSGPSKSPVKLPREDAANMQLSGGAVAATDIPGAKADGGKYVGGLNVPGASATWSTDVDKGGSYKLYVAYGVPGDDQNLSLTVNGKKSSRPVNMGNFAGAAKGDWAKGWTNTWSIVQLNKGTNTVTVSCEDGNKCDVNLDQVWLKRG